LSSTDGQVSLPLTLVSPAFGKNFAYNAVVDTGCEENWISWTVLRLLQLEATKTDPKVYKQFGNKTFVSDRVTDITWSVPSWNLSRRDEFRVSKDVSFQVLIGSKTIFHSGILKEGGNLRVLVAKKKSKGKSILTLYNQEPC
jgi:hypothetical protein